ncbi:DUF4834 family protein [Parabacteroides sp. Marseille-P3160]|uniref:DUF4834 family protein n=1 Tax=Parabacteroides sp. Marseille-P3160 TaxID=1917887 RepID=UPI0009B96D2A|nr:DUF4834 family protein [Parabacteroides sp. Marseille-P3160]
MFKMLFVIFFFFILLLFLLGFSFLRTLKRIFFGDGNPARQQAQRRQRDAYREERRGDARTTTPKKKIIPKDEGEYVDYEEVK